jgi:hypothetical protein
MQIFKDLLIKESKKTGFRPEILEKVWRLMNVLEGINGHPYLQERLVLKGGTALNLFVFDLPRLSVDIDLNYVGMQSREGMVNERPLVERALEAVFQRENLMIRRIPDKHAGGKWQLKYESVLGNQGNLEVDLNFMFRIPLWEIQKCTSKHVGHHQINEIRILDFHELGAGKLSALFGRHASRDLFDAHQLLTNCSLDIEQLRLACLVYGAMGSKDWRQLAGDEIHFEERELKDQLIPVLRKHAFRNDAWLSWTNKLLVECKTALKPLFPLRERERAFLQSLLEHGRVEGALATDDPNLIERINAHPLLQWKAKLVLENKL